MRGHPRPPIPLLAGVLAILSCSPSAPAARHAEASAGGGECTTDGAGERSTALPSSSAPSTPAAPVCDERPYMSIELALRPRMQVGASTVFAARCVGDVASPGERVAASSHCASPRRRPFPVCDGATLARAISVATFLEPTAPKQGETVFVRGRLGPGGLHDIRRGPPLGLISDRDFGGVCLLAHLTAGAKRWTCSAPLEGDRNTACCDEDPTRPATGEELVVRAEVTSPPIGMPTPSIGLFGVVDLQIMAFCLVPKHP